MTRGLVLIPAALWDAMPLETCVSLTEYARGHRVEIRAHLSSAEEALEAVTADRFPGLVSLASFGLSRDAAGAFRVPAASPTRRHVQVIPLPLPHGAEVPAWVRKAVGFVGQ